MTTYKALTDDELKHWAAMIEHPGYQVHPLVEQARRANALAAAVQYFFQTTRKAFEEDAVEYATNCTHDEKRMIAALAAYLGVQSEDGRETKP